MCLFCNPQVQEFNIDVLYDLYRNIKPQIKNDFYILLHKQIYRKRICKTLHICYNYYVTAIPIGLSFDIFFGIVADNIGFGMMLGVAIGLGGSVGVAMRGKKETSNEEKKNCEK